MKEIILINIGLLSSILIASSSTTEGKHPLEILRPLKDRSYSKNKRVKLLCVVKNATSYRWYKDGKSINQDGHIRVRGRKLIIKQFSETYVGVYECEGRDNNGNSGRTVASLTIGGGKGTKKNKDSEETADKLSIIDPCKPQTVEDTDCIGFDERTCPNVTSFATKAENVNVEIQIDFKKKPVYHVYLLVSWKVPRQGRESIWGWQIRILGKGNILGYQKCYQVNTKYVKTFDLKKALRVPSAGSTYTVEIQGIPNYMEPYDDTVVRKTIEVPGLCEMIGDRKPACCKSYVNATLDTAVGKHNRTKLFWTTHYPAWLNVTIDAFIVRWISEPDFRCNSNALRLDPVQSNYTFRNLASKCGNYTIKLEVWFSKENNETFGCEQSPPNILFYISPPDLDENTNPPAGSPPRQRSQVIATAGFAIAAIFGGIFIVAFIYIWKKGRKAKQIPDRKQAFSEEKVKVFILNPNHCRLCTEVVQALGLLLIETGHVHCDIDIFVPPREKCRGLVAWTQDMILNSDYVIIPWMCEISPPKQDNTARDMNTLCFLSSLDMIHGELLRNRDKKEKFIPVCLDHCSLEILPSIHLLLQTYNIPSKMDDLVIELLGKTRRQPDTNWPLLEFDDENYSVAKRNLEQAVNKMKKNHHRCCQKNSDSSKR